jgi:hypothetical protein
MSSDVSSSSSPFSAVRFRVAVLLATVAAVVALPLILVDLFVMLLGGTASATNPELFGPNNEPFLRVFWAPPLLALVAILMAPRNRSRGPMLGLGVIPLLLALVNSLFFFPPSGPVHASGGMVHVMKEDGTPAPGAEIWVAHGSTPPTLAGKTQTDGSFMLQGVQLIAGERHSIFASWRERGGVSTETGLNHEERPRFPVTIRLSGDR